MVCAYSLSHAPALLLLKIPGFEGHDARLLLYLVIVDQMSDVLQYVWGKLIGKNKIAWRVSPNKTWEGAVANVLAALLVAVFFGYWTNVLPAHMLAMATLGSVAGQFGDLFKSAFKRGVGVKDSGTLIPGHGGMWDRIDALIFAAPAVWYYFEWVVMRKF